LRGERSGRQLTNAKQMPEYAKDVMVAVLGASVGLGGLLLIFCGFVFSQAENFPKATTDNATIQSYKNAGTLGLWPFLGSIVNSLVVVAWFLCPMTGIYFAVLGLFIVLLIATAVYGAVVIHHYL
jgi:hypothetical protein